MKCGSCKADHATVEQVKSCYGLKGQQRPAPSDPEFQNSRGRREGDRRDLFQQIKVLGSKVEAGSYAIRNSAKATNDISFYEVVKPTDGRWTGRTFVNRKLSDESQRLTLDEQVRVLVAIAADPMNASLLYGQTIGECPECGRTLTNQDSRERGIGPKCARKRGYGDVA